VRTKRRNPRASRGQVDVLAMAPQVMFFDEDTSALDPQLVQGSWL
jgi:ABC-type polar amino acid transport system ATPase subunit